MLACEGKLTHLGLDRAPARSTLSDANNKRSYLVCETIYFKLLKQYHSFISDSQGIEHKEFENNRQYDHPAI